MSVDPSLAVLSVFSSLPPHGLIYSFQSLILFTVCLITGGVDGAALLAGLPDVPFVTLISVTPTLIKLPPLQPGHHLCALFQDKDWHHELGEAGTTACTWPGLRCEVGHCWAGRT